MASLLEECVGYKTDGEAAAYPGEDISVKGIKCFVFHEADRSVDRLFCKDPSLLYYLSLRIDESADSSISGSGDKDSIFYRPEGCDREVLVRGRGSTKPGIVRDRHQKIGSLL